MLTCVRLLMAEPNPNDPLMADIAKEFQQNPTLFQKTAREWTKKYAMAAGEDANEDPEGQDDAKVEGDSLESSSMKKRTLIDDADEKEAKKADAETTPVTKKVKMSLR